MYNRSTSINKMRYLRHPCPALKSPDTVTFFSHRRINVLIVSLVVGKDRNDSRYVLKTKDL